MLSQCFSEGSMHVGNFRMQLFQRSQPLHARGDLPRPDHRLCVDILGLGSEFDLSDDRLERLHATAIIACHELADAQDAAGSRVVRMRLQITGERQDAIRKLRSRKCRPAPVIVESFE